MCCSPDYVGNLSHPESQPSLQTRACFLLQKLLYVLLQFSTIQFQRFSRRIRASQPGRRSFLLLAGAPRETFSYLRAGGVGGDLVLRASYSSFLVTPIPYQRCSLLSVHLQPPPMTSFSCEANGDFLLMEEFVRCPNKSSWGLPRYLRACEPLAGYFIAGF